MTDNQIIEIYVNRIKLKNTRLADGRSFTAGQLLHA